MLSSIRPKWPGGLATAVTLAVCGMHSWAAAQSCANNVVPDAPTSRFTINADGTVTDQQTRLMWRRCVEGRTGDACQTGTGATVTRNWLEALSSAQASSFAGYADWRVPNVKELHSIVENRCAGPAVNTTVFPGFPSSYVWTSTPHAAFNDRAWYVGFQYGSDNHGSTQGGLPKNTLAYVLLVR